MNRPGRTMRWCLALLLISVASTVGAVDRFFPSQWTIDGVALVKNGEGTRRYGVFDIEVYRAALYLPATSADANAVLSSRGLRVLRMQYIRAVSASDARKAWTIYLQKNCIRPCVWPAPGADMFLKLVGDVRAGDTETYVFRADRVDVLRNALARGQVSAEGFPRLLLSTWIGDVPTTEQLKHALLGAR